MYIIVDEIELEVENLESNWNWGLRWKNKGFEEITCSFWHGSEDLTCTMCKSLGPIVFGLGAFHWTTKMSIWFYTWFGYAWKKHKTPREIIAPGFSSSDSVRRIFGKFDHLTLKCWTKFCLDNTSKFRLEVKNRRRRKINCVSEETVEGNLNLKLSGNTSTNLTCHSFFLPGEIVYGLDPYCCTKKVAFPLE